MRIDKLILLALCALLPAFGNGSGPGCASQSSGSKTAPPEKAPVLSAPEEIISAMAGETTASNGEAAVRAEPPAYRAARAAMVADQIAARGVADPRVLAAMTKVPRHEFVPPDVRSLAYTDQPLSIGLDQTISQPYIVAFMTEALELKPGAKVLEIGTGSGYQAAVLAEIAGEVYSIEILCELSDRARRTLEGLGYDNIRTRCGDGYKGWPERAPFDAIIVTAAPDHVPQPLIDQLKTGGRMVIPVGSFSQELVRLAKTGQGVKEERLLPVRFVPMTGEAEKK